MIQYTVSDGAIIFTVRVIPRSSRSEIVGEHGGSVKIKLTAPPVDGSANDELVKLIAKRLGIPKGSVALVSGKSSRTKQLRVEGVTPRMLSELLADS